MIGILGISYKKAPLAIREKFTFTNDEIILFADIVQQTTDITELVVLTTCNRTEIYFCHKTFIEKKTFKVLTDKLHTFKKIDESFHDYFYSYTGREAVTHLFRVVSGADSMVIGEDQIVKQVKKAYLYCTENNLTDAVLMRMFQKSFEAGKRVRTETLIQHGATSVSYVAVELCSGRYEDLSDKTVLLLGSGEMGSLTLKHLRKRGLNHMYISNRTFEKAERLSVENHCQPVKFEEVDQYLQKSDIVVVATNANSHLIKSHQVESAQKIRDYMPQTYIDLSVPRNIDETIKTVKGVTLIEVDDIEPVVKKNNIERKKSIVEADTIINEMVDDYYDWYETRNLKPVIQSITSNMQKLKVKEISSVLNSENRNNSLTYEQFAEILVQRYTRSIIKNLKVLAKNGHSASLLKDINDLFQF